MGYQVGISSGWWYIGKDPNLLGLAQKAAGFGATAGVTFNQIDLESMSEFLEPKVRENMRRVQKELGLKIGMHAEIGNLAALESAERRLWEQSHVRLLETVKNAADLNVVYVNIHLSSSTILQFNEAQLRPFGYQYQVVTPYGQPFGELAEKSKAVKEYITRRLGSSRSNMQGIIASDPVYQRMVDEESRKYTEVERQKINEVIKALEKDPEYINAAPATKRIIRDGETNRVHDGVQRDFERAIHSPEFFYRAWRNSNFAKYTLEAGEIDAYTAVGKYMKETGDTLWSNIAKNSDPESAYINPDLQFEFNAAIASKYIEGHLLVKDHPLNKRILDGMSILEWLKKTGIILALEIPEAERQQEALYRLYDPRHSQWLIRKLGSKEVRLCIDFEHMLAQKLDPYKIIPQLPGDFGKLVYLFHLGEPKPYWGTAHIPIPLGSQAQEVLYEWLYMLRQKGFTDGILIFERGGGRSGGKTPFEVFEQSVLALRQIAENLEKNIPPKELPLTFYGMSEKNVAAYSRALVTIRDHAWDPLEGVLSVPEEKHTFLSRAAVEKQKAQEWEKRKLR